LLKSEDAKLSNQQTFEVYKVQTSVYFANSDMLKKKLIGYFEPKEDDIEVDDEKSLKLSKNLNESFISTKYIINDDVEKGELAISNTLSIKYLILDFSGVNYVDSDGVRMLKHLIEDLKAKNVPVYICQFQG
jgi:MFS superfamily sulfate permease-like transporter